MKYDTTYYDAALVRALAGRDKAQVIKLATFDARLFIRNSRLFRSVAL